MDRKKKEDENSVVAPPRGWGTRHTIAVLCFCASAVSYAIRFKLSLAIVAMVKSRQPTFDGHVVDSDDPLANVTCPNLIEIPLNTSINGSSMGQGHSSSATGEFDWNEAEQGVILGSFFWGYMLTQWPGGLLCKRFGGKWPFGIGLLIAGVSTVLTPWAVRVDKGLLIFARVVEGLASGIHISAQTTLISNWAPPNERSLLCTVAYGGTFVGTAVTMIMSGYLIHENILGGWPSVFYAVGLLTFLWFAVWAAVVYNSPADHPWISVEERNYIEGSLGSRNKKDPKIPTPWKEVVTCVPLWATFIAHVAHAWGIYTLLTEMPTFMKTVLHFNIQKNSWLSAVPYLCSMVVGIVFAQIGDVLLRKNIVRIISVRKTAQILAHGGSALALLGCAFSGCNQVLSVFYLILSVSLSAIGNSGFIANYMDLAPNHAGTIIGAANTFANICGALAPNVAGRIINNDPSLENWRIVFAISATILLIGAVTFVTFASGDEQPWNAFQKLPETSDADDQGPGTSGPHIIDDDDSDTDDSSGVSVAQKQDREAQANLNSDDRDSDDGEADETRIINSLRKVKLTSNS